MSVDVGAWLQELGLGHYLPQFEASQIDIEALPFVTDGHLREIGLPIGPRIRLLAAIERLGLGGAVTDTVERRRLTVMFADLVGSTPLSTVLDPEDLREVIRSFHYTVDVEIARFDAFVAQYKGDGALVYFGYPRAHEDDAECAVRAALAINRAVAQLRTPAGVPLAAHIGIATGLSVVGDTFGHSTARERSAIGETPNLAARLVDLAPPGAVVVSRQTYQLARHQFEFEDLGSHPLKGLREPVAAYRVVAERPSETRFDARHGAAPLQMVGRGRELAALVERWDRAAASHGQVVLVSGEAGIGKSRLVRALEESLADRPHVRITNQCSPQHTHSALFPMARQIARAADLAAEDAPALQLEKLRHLLKDADGAELALTAALLDLDAKALGTPLDMTPAQQRARTFLALLHHLERTASQQPVLWLLEDAHWIDPTSLELVELCIQRVATIPVLAVITFRPEFVHNFRAAPHVCAVQLSRLTQGEVAALVHNLGGGKTVPAPVVAQIAAQTDGVPLFVEELTKSLLESGELVERDGAYELPDTLRRLTVPASLHDSLMARLDRQRTQKEVAQIASCIGREFGHALLERVAGLPPAALAAALAQLCDAELVFEQGTAKDRHYVFKHALLCDAAYESLLKSRREDLHARILGVLQHSPDTPAEVLAHHATQAGLGPQAITLWGRAAALAMSRTAFAEAVSHLTQALALNARLPAGLSAGTDVQKQRLDLLLALGQATIPLRGYSHSASVEVFSQAQQLAQALHDGQRAFWVSYARWVVHYVRGEHHLAHDIARAMLAQAQAEGHDGWLLTALRALGISEMISGAPTTADATFGHAERLADQVRMQPRERRMAVAQRFAADPEIATQFHVALTHWALGRIDTARALADNAIAAARAMGHVHTLGHALAHGAIVAVVDRDADRAIALCEETALLADKHDMDLWRGYGSILHGFAVVLADDAAQGVRLLQSGLKQLADTETGTMVPMHHAVCAFALARLGRHGEALVHASRVQAELQQGSERYFWIDSLIWLGRYQMLSPHGGEEQALAAYTQALAEARRQGALGWELRAATAVGRLWLARGEAARAVDLVAPLAERLREGRNSVLWVEAQNLVTSAVRGTGPGPQR